MSSSAWVTENERYENVERPLSNRMSLFTGITIGILLGSIVLAAVVALYLSEPETKIATTSLTYQTTLLKNSTTTAAPVDTTTSTNSQTTSISTSTTTTAPVSTVGIYALNISPCATWNPVGMTVAGNANGTGDSDLMSLRTPTNIFIDTNDTLYIGDQSNYRVVKFFLNATSGIVVAGNGTAGTSAYQLLSPKGAAVDEHGNLIVADSGNYRIQLFPSGVMTGTTIAMNSSSNLGVMRDLQVDINNNIYVTDSTNHQILQFVSPSSTGIVLAGANGAGNNATQLSSPFGNHVDSNSTLYVADYGNHRIQMFISGSTTGITVAGNTNIAGSTLNLLNSPVAVITDNNQYIYIADYGNHRIVRWTTNYTAGGTCLIGCTGIAGSSTSQLRSPRDLKFDKYGNLYVADQGNNRIQKFLINSTCTNYGG